ncbi:MAG: hypothetical protein A2Y12_06270 [Planctomycetes bacterium GWF2_42_9]|nr:MAG: hypothetical protein A2Y12_06270 [Planctomycetes bacterium GWF2_42_9]
MNKFLEHRIFRSKDADYWSYEIENCLETHSEQRLKAIADAGFTGIWVRGMLRELCPTALFEKYYPQAQTNISKLQQLSARAAKYGLGLWMFFTEPLGLDVNSQFWKDNPNLAGCKIQVYDRTPEYSLCSSTKEVQDYLKNGFAELASQIDLQGIFLITASEHINNCWAHVLTKPENFESAETFWLKECKCPRCGQRKSSDVICEIIDLIHKGVKSSNPKTKIVVWDWSWNMNSNPPYSDIVGKLPKDITLMGDFERGGHIKLLDKKLVVEEYSMMYTGPSERYKAEVEKHSPDREMFIRSQLNTTHELNSVCNLPMIVSIFRKLKYAYESNIAGCMFTWNFAAETDTLNVFLLKEIVESYNGEDENAWLTKLAEKYFGTNINTKEIVEAWYLFDNAGKYYPMNGNKFVYFAPVNYAPAYDLKLKFDGSPMGSCDSREPHGDYLEESFGSLNIDEIIQLLEKLVSGWKIACDKYVKAIGQHIEIYNALTAYHCFRSTLNIYKWYKDRKPLQNEPMTNTQKNIIADEIENLHCLKAILKKDKRLGFNLEARMYMFNGELIDAKLGKLQKIMSL